MKNRTAIVAAAAILLAGTLETRSARQDAATPQELKVNIDTRQAARPVSPYEYGKFIEHIGSLIYRSLWCEMLDDRKFYFQIKAEEPQAAAPAQGGPFRNIQLRKWRAIGPIEAVAMDREQPFVGEQSPQVNLDASTPHGIRQSGFTLAKGRSTRATSVFALRLQRNYTSRLSGVRARTIAKSLHSPKSRPHTSNCTSPFPQEPIRKPVRSRLQVLAAVVSSSA